MIRTFHKTACVALGLVLAIRLLVASQTTVAGPSPSILASDPTDASLLAPYVENSAGCLSSVSPPPLVGDVNGDGYVNIGDLQLLIASWGVSHGTPGFNTEADFNCDAYVNVGDLQLLVSNWGAQS